MITCEPRSLVGLSSTGLKSISASTPAAIACSAWARPISPPSTVTALFSAMFCGLNGATRMPPRRASRHKPATSVLLPASEVVPWIISVPRGANCRGVSIAIGSLGSRYGSARRYNIAMTSPDLTFILGGARSGKSAYAEQLAADSGLPVTYVATARIGDAEFAARVEQHRERRPAHWAVVEAPLDLGGVLRELDREGHVVLIDCLTLWLANLLFPADGTVPDGPPLQAFGDFDAALSNVRGKVIIVSNEIGLGVVPMGSVTRLYVDELGRLNQRVAAASTHVTMMVAGLPLVLKG